MTISLLNNVFAKHKTITLTKDTIFYAVLNPYFAGYSGYTILTSLAGGWLAGSCSIFRATYVVLLLDEFDFIAKARSSGQDVGEMHRVVNILLNLLEDYETPGLLVATTNLEGTLDKASFRRFDDIIEIPKPGKEEIVRLLSTTLSSIKVSKIIMWDEIAAKMKGFSAAHVVKVANDAAKTAVIQNQKTVEKEHLLKALSENVKYNK